MVVVPRLQFRDPSRWRSCVGRPGHRGTVPNWQDFVDRRSTMKPLSNSDHCQALTCRITRCPVTVYDHPVDHTRRNCDSKRMIKLFRPSDVEFYEFFLAWNISRNISWNISWNILKKFTTFFFGQHTRLIFFIWQTLPFIHLCILQLPKPICRPTCLVCLFQYTF